MRHRGLSARAIEIRRGNEIESGVGGFGPLDCLVDEVGCRRVAGFERAAHRYHIGWATRRSTLRMTICTSFGFSGPGQGSSDRHAGAQ